MKLHQSKLTDLEMIELKLMSGWPVDYSSSDRLYETLSVIDSVPKKTLALWFDHATDLLGDLEYAFLKDTAAIIRWRTDLVCLIGDLDYQGTAQARCKNLAFGTREILQYPSLTMRTKYLKECLDALNVIQYQQLTA